MDLPVADPWFVRERIKRCTLISEPHVHPLLRCNVWHVRGPGPRPGRRHGRSAWRRCATWSSASWDTTAVGRGDPRPRRPRGRAARVRRAARSTGPRRRPVGVRRRHRRSTPRGVRTSGRRGPYRDAGYDIPDLLVDAVPAGRARRPRPGRSARPLRPRRVLDDGDVVDLGDRAFEVLHLPGHSPGSIGLWEAATGDACSPATPCTTARCSTSSTDRDIDAYVATMQPAARRCRSRWCTAATSRASGASASSSCATPTWPAEGERRRVSRGPTG